MSIRSIGPNWGASDALEAYLSRLKARLQKSQEEVPQSKPISLGRPEIPTTPNSTGMPLGRPEIGVASNDAGVAPLGRPEIQTGGTGSTVKPMPWGRPRFLSE
jgi:hypothetical protein